MYWKEGSNLRVRSEWVSVAYLRWGPGKGAVVTPADGSPTAPWKV